MRYAVASITYHEILTQVKHSHLLFLIFYIYAFTYLACVCVRVRMHTHLCEHVTCHRTCTEVRGPLTGGVSLLLLCGSWKLLTNKR